MPNLGDYLGQLLSEISIARMQADLETVRIAELYASHPLLRTMPVPHFRLPEVDLDIPVLIETAEEPRADQSARGGATIQKMRQAFDKLLAERLSREGIKLSPPERKRLKKALDEREALQLVPQEISIDVRRVADDFTTTALNAIREFRLNKEQPTPSPGLASELKEISRLEMVKLRTPPPRLKVQVTTNEIREAGPAENVTRLRLRISEQAVEWTSIEQDGVPIERLTPE